MKKLFRLFTGVALFASLFAVNVHALGVEEGNNSASENVTVGSVDTPVYSVDITWGDFSYDWVYDSTTSEYKWENTKMTKCGQVMPEDAGSTTGIYASINYTADEYAAEVTKGNIYSDTTCSTTIDSVAYADIMSTPVYSKFEGEAYQGLVISDNSSLGQVVPSVAWTSGANYDWVTGKFLYNSCDFNCAAVTDETMFNEMYQLYSDSSCSAAVDKSQVTYQANTFYAMQGGCVQDSMTSGALPDSSRQFGGVNAETGVIGYAYFVDFELEVDSSKTIITPKSGDTIGSITVSFAAK